MGIKFFYHRKCSRSDMGLVMVGHTLFGNINININIFSISTQKLFKPFNSSLALNF